MRKTPRPARHTGTVPAIHPTPPAQPSFGLTAPSADASVARKASATVSMLVVRGLISAAERAGADRGELLRASGLDASQLAAPDQRLSLREVFGILEHALKLTGDPALGLHWAERLSGSTFVPISYLMAHSGSLRQAFESLARFGSLLSDEAGYELLERDDKVTLLCRMPSAEPPSVQRFVAEMVLANFFRIVGKFKTPERACFAYPAPPYQAEYARVFCGTAQFEQPFTGIVFERAVLDMSPPHKDADVHEAMRTLAERRVARVDKQVPYAVRVRELLVQGRWPKRIDMPQVARSLGMSLRSLRRYLSAEGTSYSELDNEAFAIVATRLLRDKQRTIQETAYEMGFSDASTFHRAFKRATGMTPSQCREQ